MSAIDVSAFISTDTPEVAALKDKVRTVAEKYKKRHNWCQEVERALVEMGVDEAKKHVIVRTTLTNGVAISVRIPVDDLNGKGEDVQKAVIAKAVGSLHLSGGGSGVIGGSTLLVTATMIESMELQSPIPGATTSAGGGDGWYYTSNLGRVMHNYSNYTLESARTRGFGYFDAVCGRGSTNINEMTTTSSLGEDRRCTRCEARS